MRLYDVTTLKNSVIFFSCVNKLANVKAHVGHTRWPPDVGFYVKTKPNNYLLEIFFIFQANIFET